MALGRAVLLVRTAAVATLLAFACAAMARPAAADDYVANRTTQAITIDGDIGELEWSDASFNIVPFTGREGSVRFLYDDNYLYEAVTVSGEDATPILSTYFENGDNEWTNGEDGTRAVIGTVNEQFSEGPNAGDFYHFLSTIDPAEAWIADTSTGGSNDVVAAATTNGQFASFEIRHPLCTDEQQDFCVEPGFTTLGVDFQYQSSLSGSIYYPSDNVFSPDGWSKLSFAGASVPDTTPPTVSVTSPRRAPRSAVLRCRSRRLPRTTSASTTSPSTTSTEPSSTRSASPTTRPRTRPPSTRRSTRTPGRWTRRIGWTVRRIV